MTRKKVARNLYRPLFGGEPHANVRIPRIIWYFHLSLLHNAYNAYMCTCMSLLSKGSHVQDPGPTYFPPPSPGTRCCRICQSIFVLEFLLSGYSWFPVTYSLPKAIRAGQIDINRIIQKRFIWIWMMLVSTVFFFIATELKLLLCMYVIVPEGIKLVAFPVALSRHCFR